MIVVLSLNTAVDRTLAVAGFSLDRVFRAEHVTISAGGKGLNVAHTVRRLGAPVSVIGFLGGAPTEFVRQSCADAGIIQHWVTTSEESRTCVIVTDPTTGRQTVVNESGPEISSAVLAELQYTIQDTVKAGDLVCISGSAPPGVPETWYAELVQDLRAREIRVLVDTSGPALKAAIENRPWAVAPNDEEAAAALGLPRAPEHLALLLARQADHALLTLGSEGLMYAHAGVTRRYLPPPIETRNAVASGDAFAAGFLVGIERGESADDAIRLGIAAGASNAARATPGIGDAAEITRLVDEVTTG